MAIIQYEGPEKFVETKMLLHRYPDHTILLVEGSTDSQVYGKFVDKKTCDIVFFDDSAVNEVLQKATRWNQEFKGQVLGIIDADCKHLENFETPNNVFKTDTRDLESLIMCSDSFDTFLEKVVDSKELEKFENSNGNKLKLILLDRIKQVGYLQCYNFTEQWGLKFKGIDFEEFIDKKTFKIQFQALFKRIKENSPPHFFKFPTVDEIEQEINNKCKSGIDLWLVCRGHDLTEILTIGLRDIFGNDLIKQKLDERESIDEKRKYSEKIMRKTYSFNSFQKTKLFYLIKNWEKNNNSRGILPPMELKT